jgi:predicted DNA-binding transcriptional regulator AlpA
MHPAEYRKLDTSEAAEYAGVSASTLSKRRVFGGGPKYLKLGRRVVYDTRDLDAWLDAHRRASTSDADEVAAIPDHRAREAGSTAPGNIPGVAAVAPLAGGGRKLPRRRGKHVVARASR